MIFENDGSISIVPYILEKAPECIGNGSQNKRIVGVYVQIYTVVVALGIFVLFKHDTCKLLKACHHGHSYFQACINISNARMDLAIQ